MKLIDTDTDIDVKILNFLQYEKTIRGWSHWTCKQISHSTHIYYTQFLFKMREKVYGREHVGAFL